MAEFDDNGGTGIKSKVPVGYPMDSVTPPWVVVANKLQDDIANNRPFFWTSLKQDTHEDKINVMRRLQGKENDLEWLAEGNTIQVKDVILTRISFNDKNGNPVFTPKAVVISPDGVVKTVLAGVWVSELVSLFNMFQLPPWNEPVYLSAKAQKGHGANRYYSLVVK